MPSDLARRPKPFVTWLGSGTLLESAHERAVGEHVREGAPSTAQSDVRGCSGRRWAKKVVPPLSLLRVLRMLMPATSAVRDCRCSGSAEARRILARQRGERPAEPVGLRRTRSSDMWRAARKPLIRGRQLMRWFSWSDEDDTVVKVANLICRRLRGYVRVGLTRVRWACSISPCRR